tara:strand:- start:82 stop:396 length:315 start_codon:yes stop_codon:yes gene_type:complete
MLLKNLIKKLIDHTYFADHKVYIELYEHDKENDTLKCYKLNITDVAEGGNLGQEEYTKIVANVASCVEIDNDYVPPSEDEIARGQKFGRFIEKLTKKKITFINK